MIDLIEVTRKLIGKVRPLGNTYVDRERYANLEEMLELTGNLITEIEAVAEYEGSPESSINSAGNRAARWLRAWEKRMIKRQTGGNR